MNSEHVEGNLRTLVMIGCQFWRKTSVYTCSQIHPYEAPLSRRTKWSVLGGVNAVLPLPAEWCPDINVPSPPGHRVAINGPTLAGWKKLTLGDG